MKLYELFGERGFHTSIVTSFGVDFDAYENVVLSRLRGAGCHNNMLLVDRNMLGLALEEGSAPPRFAGRRYTATGAPTSKLFHPKIILQLGRTKARLLVSSANMTSSGLAGNLEVAGIVETDGKPSGETSLVAAAWTYLSRFLLRDDTSTRQQVEWMLNRTPFLASLEPPSMPVTLSDGSIAGFLATDEDTGIGSRFLGLLADDRISRFVVVSPYWDNGLDSLHRLTGRARSTVVLLDNGRHQFPASALPNSSRIEIRDYKPGDKSRFVHAKTYIAQSMTADHVLYGSANCTVAALGTDAFSGTNEEACLYRRLPAGAAIDALNLAPILDAEPLDKDEVEEIEDPGDLPFDEIAARFPGRFECHYATLVWWPATQPALGAVIELAGIEGTFGATLSTEISPGTDGERRYALSDPNQRPAFARIRNLNGTHSAAAIVVQPDALREEVRDTRSRRIEAVIEELDGETEVGLWLLETLNAIEAAEVPSTNEAHRRPIPSRTSTPPVAPEAAQTLSYEQFIAGRRLRSDLQAHLRNSLAGSDLSHVRGFLNRLLEIGSPSTVAAEEADLSGAFQMGDEQGASDSAIEDGFGEDDPSNKANTPDELRRKAIVSARRRANREQLVDAVADLHDIVRENASERGLRATDLLRLRAIIILLAASAAGDTAMQSAVQVLPPTGDPEAAWPRLIGRALHSYFGGNRPPIASLAIATQFDHVPDDVLECWGTCLWAANLSVLAAEKFGEKDFLRRQLTSLRNAIYTFTGLLSPDKMPIQVSNTITAMNARFSHRVGIPADAIEQAHSRMLVAADRKR
jgi:hypothetical protein